VPRGTLPPVDGEEREEEDGEEREEEEIEVEEGVCWSFHTVAEG
jgi:hypothetical protein